MKNYLVKMGNEIVYETEDREEAFTHCECLNEAYRANSYYVEENKLNNKT